MTGSVRRAVVAAAPRRPLTIGRLVAQPLSHLLGHSYVVARGGQRRRCRPHLPAAAAGHAAPRGCWGVTRLRCCAVREMEGE